MFWGLIMEPKRRYTQTVQKAFHISKAALDINNCDDEPTQLILTYNSRNYLLCTLQKDKVLQCSLNLNFNVGDVICFATNGKCNIHLSGYLVDEDFEDEDELSEDEEVPILVGQKRKGTPSIEQAKKKSKTQELLEEEYDSEDDTTFNLPEDEEDDGDSDLDEEDDEDDEGDEDMNIEAEDNEESSEEENETVNETNKKPVNGLSPKLNEKKSKRQKQKERKNQQKNVEKSPKPDIPNKSTPKSNKAESVEKNQVPQLKRTLEGGVVVQDLKEGTGALVKSGKAVQVYYEGRLKSNNKLFDANKQGPGFKFRVGKQEVIKGWDIGLVGMKVGGKRRISCPPAMAYGQKGSPPVIPPNSTLIFEVEVKNVL